MQNGMAKNSDNRDFIARWTDSFAFIDNNLQQAGDKQV